jgi:hypothetical protein
MEENPPAIAAGNLRIRIAAEKYISVLSTMVIWTLASQRFF